MQSPRIGHTGPLPVSRLVSIGAYLDAGALGDVLLPKRYLPQGAKPGDVVEAFLYHDSEGRVIATTQRPHAQAGEVAVMEVVSKNKQGAFLDWGLQKDLFLPLNQQESRIREGMKVLAMVYIDERTGRLAASEKIGRYLSNEGMGLTSLDAVSLIIWRETDLGYAVIVNGRHEGLLFFSDVYEPMQPGQQAAGYIRAIQPGGKLDIALGKPGFARMGDAGEKIMEQLRAQDGYLPLHDKSDPKEVYAMFGFSKKVFKAALGGLLKSGTVELTKTGVKLL